MESEASKLELFKLHSPVARRIATYYRRRLPSFVLFEDLVSAAMGGLWDAVRLHPEGGPGFPFYAATRVRGAILDDLRGQDWLPRRFRRTRGDHVSRVPLDTVGEDPDMVAPKVASSSDVENEVCEREESAALRSWLSVLKERDEQIIRRIYFGGERFKDVGLSIGVTEPRISQIHYRAIRKLRENVPEEIMASVRARY